jgi:phosphoglycolate phosphatase-like HAD superfamily hydrolase
MLAFKALLFDLDGTLFDTAPDFISALNIQLVMHGREPLPASAVRTSVTHGSAGLIQDGFGITPDHVDFESIRQQYLDLYFNNLADQTDLFPGMEEVLARCEHDNIPWGIVTNKPWKYSYGDLPRSCRSPKTQPRSNVTCRCADFSSSQGLSLCRRPSQRH